MNNKQEYLILLDNGHGFETKGKCSPDGKLKEYSYTREIVLRIYTELKKKGYNPHILVPENSDISLNTRVKRANQLSVNKKSILISVHCNAVGSDGKWHTARGWSVFVAQNASANSKKLANCLKANADKLELKVRLQYPNKSYWVQSLAICRDTKCPAVLTENLFLDNEEDTKFLLSENGKKVITDLHVNGIIDYLCKI